MHFIKNETCSIFIFWGATKFLSIFLHKLRCLEGLIFAVYYNGHATKMENNLNNSKQPDRQLSLKKLDVFIGKWHAEGQSYADGQQKDKPYSSAVPWTSDESYEWLQGNFFLLHRWDAKAGDKVFIGTEIIGYDEKEGGYFTRFFDNAGFHPDYKATVDGNVWNFTEPSTRARVTVDDDKNTITFNWEWRNENSDWLPLCDRVATRIK